jgi:integration host factor subunit alpha
MSITKKDIADLLVEQIGITHNQALSMTNNFFETIKGSLAKGEDVKLSGFGNFIISRPLKTHSNQTKPP